MRWLVCILYLGGWVAQSAPFRNLDFEEADLSRITRFGLPEWIHDYGSGTVADLLPGWRVLRPENELNGVGYNWPGPRDAFGQYAANLAQKEIVADIFPDWTQRYTFTFSGKYALLVQSHSYTASSVLTLQQTGDIPATAAYLEYDAVQPVGKVLVNGVELPGSSLGNGHYVHDISRFSGLTADLRFVFGPDVFGNGVQNGIDNIRFSPIPEPGTLAILGVGGGLLLLLGRRRGIP